MRSLPWLPVRAVSGDVTSGCACAMVRSSGSPTNTTLSVPIYHYQRRYKYHVLGRDRSYFVIHHSDSTKKLSETDIFNMLEFLIDDIFVIFGGRVLQDSRHTYGYQLCSSSRRLVPLFVWGRLHTGASQEKRKEANPIL